MRGKINLKLIATWMMLVALIMAVGCMSLSGSNRPGTSNAGTKTEAVNPSPPSAVDKATPGDSTPNQAAEVPAPASSNDSPSSSGKTPGVLTRLWVTTDYGQGVISRQEVPLKPGDTILDLLSRHLKIETAYGGGFVKAIAGIASGYTGPSNAERSKKDWFFYVNGILMDRGVDDYLLTGGETIWCDYHSWDGTWFAPALAGAFPEPFRQGYDNSTSSVELLVVGDQPLAAQKLTAHLTSWGVSVNKAVNWNEKLVRERRHPTIMVGLVDDFLQIQEIRRLMDHARQSGVFCIFEAGKIVALDDRGNRVTVYGAASGCLAAAGSGMGDTAPWWIIAGVDGEGLEAAIDLLRPGVDPFSYGWNVVVSPQGVVSLPLQ